MASTYTQGDLVKLTATFVDDETGEVADPTSIVFTVRAPDGTVTTPGQSKLSTGVYRALADTTPGPVGRWRWKAVGIGAVQAASSPEQGVFTVVAQTP